MTLIILILLGTGPSVEPVANVAAGGDKAGSLDAEGETTPPPAFCSLASVPVRPPVVEVATGGSAPPLAPATACPGHPRKERANPSADTPGISLFLAGPSGPEVPKEVAASLGVADKVLQRLWSALREVALAVEPSFKVSIVLLW